MALVHADRVKETSTTTGTGTYSLAGALTGFRTFVAGIATGNTCYYAATDGTDWEIGLGTVTDATPDTLARTTILASSNAGAAVNWGAGTKTLFCTPPAGKFRAIGEIVPTTDMHAGAVLQCLQTTYSTNTDLTTVIPEDDTTPTSSEGTEVLSQAITPRNTSSKILVLVYCWGTADSGLRQESALFRGTTCINATRSSNFSGPTICYLDSPASGSAQTYSVRVGPNAAGLIRLNGTATARLFGGASACTLIVIEIAG